MKSNKRINSNPTKSNTHLSLLSHGYIRKYFNTKNINPSDIAQIISTFLSHNWTFDTYYDYTNTKGLKMHNISNDGKTIKCDYDWGDCYCFFASFSLKMKPQTGIYQIKFKINKVRQAMMENIIGIISYDCYNRIINDNNNKSRHNTLKWIDGLYGYIGWSTDSHDSNKWPNGLLCGEPNHISGVNNIFRQNKFEYHSNNENYKEKLPPWQENDIVILQYDSDLSTLLFSKENDNGKLDSYIKNLPKKTTFCWFVGHQSEPMSLTIVD